MDSLGFWIDEESAERLSYYTNKEKKLEPTIDDYIKSIKEEDYTWDKSMLKNLFLDPHEDYKKFEHPLYKSYTDYSDEMEAETFEAKGGYERKDKYIYHECFECGYKTEPIPLVRAQSRICPKCKGHPEDEDGYDVATMIAYEDIEKTMALRKKERLENLFSKHPDMSEELKNHYKNKYEAESSKPHSVTISRSSNSEKKLMAVFEDSEGKKIKTTHFGQRGASDYTKHGDKERMQRYLERHGGGTTTSTKEDWKDPTTAGALSRWILWNKPSLSASFSDYKSRFGLKGSINVSKSAEDVKDAQYQIGPTTIYDLHEKFEPYGKVETTFGNYATKVMITPKQFISLCYQPLRKDRNQEKLIKYRKSFEKGIPLHTPVYKSKNMNMVRKLSDMKGDIGCNP